MTKKDWDSQNKPKTVKFTLKRDLEAGEYIVKVWIDGKYNDMASYFSGGLGPNEKQDAITTLKMMKKEYQEKGYTLLESKKVNPWAVCTASTGNKSGKKRECCIKKLKKKINNENV